MDFKLSDEQAAIVGMARDFAAAELAPFAIEWDQQKHFPIETIRKAGALGMRGIYVRDDIGCPSIAAYISIHNMAAWMIDRFGNDGQRRQWLPRLTSFETLASYCLTEPGAGSDAAALKTRAVRDGDHYVLDGQKQFVSGRERPVSMS
jgi:alkylation response protein AidB-like acyl-CoA dehydrogenase